MEHLRVVVIPVAEIYVIVASLDVRIATLARNRARDAYLLPVAESARATLQAAIDHPVHPPERHKEATL
jgi:hypothetical protein